MMKTRACIWVAIGLLWFTSTGDVAGEEAAAPENSAEEEEIGVCGPVPNHGQMMAVLKPMSHIVVCAVNQIMDYGILLKDIQRVVERICLVFDGCVPSGKLASNKENNPEVKCLKEHCFSEINQEGTSLNDSAFSLVFNCVMHPLLPLQKQHIWSVIHWVLQMTNM